MSFWGYTTQAYLKLKFYDQAQYFRLGEVSMRYKPNIDHTGFSNT